MTHLNIIKLNENRTLYLDKSHNYSRDLHFIINKTFSNLKHGIN